MDDIDLSTAPSEQIKVVDENTAIKYSVVSETIDLAALRNRKKQIEDALAVTPKEIPAQANLSDGIRDAIVIYNSINQERRANLQLDLDNINLELAQYG